jgi:lambda family phage tail tape measure protein
MADDIVSFGMEIDSSAARQAKQDLNSLAQSGPAVEQALNRLKGAGASGAAGVSAVSQAAKTVERDMSAARRSAIDFGSALRAAFAGVTIMSVIDTADTWGQFASRMKMATEGADEYAHAQERMVQSAQTTFRSINETRESFIQLSPVLREMGYSLDQSIDAVDAFSGLLVVSGANAERGANAMNALAKSLQKGKVDAEAWMTIYTTADSIVTHLAASSGKSANEIRQLGAAGKITGDMLAQALVTGYKPIIKAVEDMPTTVRDAFTNLNTQFTEYVGRANEANGATQGLVTGINALSANFGTLADTGLYVVGAALALYTSRTIGAVAASVSLAAAEAYRSKAIIGTLKYEVDATAAVVARTRANVGLTASLAELAAAESAHAAASARYAAAQAGAVGVGRTLLGVLGGPVGIVATLGLAAGAAYMFGSKSEAATGGVDALRGSVDLLTVSLKEMGQAALTNTKIKIGDEIDDLGKSAAVTKLKIESLGTQMNAMPAGSPLREGMHREMMQAAEDYETLTGRMSGLINKQKEIDDQLKQITDRRAAGTPKASDPEVAKRLQSMRDELELTKLTGAARARLAAIQKLGANATAQERAEAEKLATQIYQLEQSRKGTTAEAKKDRIKDLINSPEIQDSMKQYQKYLDAVEDTQSRLADSQTKYQRELDAMGKGDWARQVNAALQSIEDKYRDILEQRRNSPQGLTDDELKVFQDAMEREKLLAIQHYADLKKIQGDWLLGAQDALANYSDSAENVYQSIGQMVQNSFRGMEDALTTFVTTGKLSFKGLADSIISDMVRIAIQQSITGPLAGALGGALSGMFGSSLPSTASWALPKMNAKGGVYDSPSLSAYSNQIHDTPKLFTFARGAGVFGEAGPEAIMPLKRGPDGRLGVSTDAGRGAGDVTVNITNVGGQPMQAAGQPKVSIDSMGRMFIDLVVENITRHGQVAKAIEGRYGLR